MLISRFYLILCPESNIGDIIDMSSIEYVQIKELKPGMKNINAVFIVLDVGAPTLTKEAREVRTLRVADASACVNLSVWDEPGALLQPGDIVRLTRGYASLWRAALTLYSGKSGDIQKVTKALLIYLLAYKQFCLNIILIFCLI